MSDDHTPKQAGHSPSYRVLRVNGAVLAVGGLVFALLGPGSVLENLGMGGVLLVPGVIAFLGARRFEAWEQRMNERRRRKREGGEAPEERP